MKKLLLLLSALSLALVGCTSADTKVTADQEKAWRNPSKEIPPDVLKQMQESKAKDAERLKREMAKSGAGAPPAGR